MIADTNITFDVGCRAYHGSGVKLRLRGRDDQNFASVFRILLEAGRSPVRRDHNIVIAFAEPVHVVGYGEWNVLFAEQPEQSAIRFVPVRAPASGRRTQQQYASGARLANVVFLVLSNPAEDRF